MKLQGNRKYCFLGNLGFNCTEKRNIFEMSNSLFKKENTESEKGTDSGLFQDNWCKPKLPQRM